MQHTITLNKPTNLESTFVVLIIANKYLDILGYEGVAYAIGDCASITNPITGKAVHPAAQHAIKQGKVVSNNIFYGIKRKRKEETNGLQNNQMMAG